MSNVEDFRDVMLGASQDQIGRLTPSSFDPSRYGAEMDQFDISEDQKLELLTTLWSIMRSFVELGFQGDVCAMVFPEIGTIPDEAEVG